MPGPSPIQEDPASQSEAALVSRATAILQQLGADKFPPDYHEGAIAALLQCPARDVADDERLKSELIRWLAVKLFF